MNVKYADAYFNQPIGERLAYADQIGFSDDIRPRLSWDIESSSVSEIQRTEILEGISNHSLHFVDAWHETHPAYSDRR